MQGQENESTLTVRPAYRWPYYVGAMVLLGMILAVMWTLWSVNQTRELRRERGRIDSLGYPVSKTNQVNQ